MFEGDKFNTKTLVFSIGFSLIIEIPSKVMILSTIMGNKRSQERKYDYYHQDYDKQ
jgi:hypothetical protein